MSRHVASQAGHVSSSSRRPSLSYESDLAVDPDCPSPQQSLSSPSSPSLLPDTAPMGAAQEKPHASGSHRSRSRSQTNETAGDAKGKRKRSRVTPEQLAHLERFFATDRSPTAARRKEISEMLGMQERQTQIWFQNRRAKAKLLDGKHDQEAMELPPDMPPPLAAGWDAELQMLVHEDEPITIIPCTELSIGSWRRLASAVGKYDLVAYICHRRQRLAWFIYSSGCGFKIEVPFETVIDTKFVNSTPGMGQASFILAQPPHFFMEVASQEVASDGLPVRIWKPSTDWTEKMQATKVFRHDLIGAAIQLAHVLRTIAASKSGPSVPLYPLSYESGYPSTQSSPPPSGLHPSTVAGTVADGIAGPSQPQQPNNGSQQRRFSRTSLYYQEPSLELAAGTAPSNTMRSTYHSLPPRSSPVIPAPYPMTPDPSMASSPLASTDHGVGPPPEQYHHLQVPISQTISRRSLSGPPGPQGDVVFGNEEMDLTPSISYRGRRQSTSSDSVSPTSSLSQSMSSLSTASSHPPSSWDPRRALMPPSPYLLTGGYASASPSPHPAYSPQSFH